MRASRSGGGWGGSGEVSTRADRSHTPMARPACCPVPEERAGLLEMRGRRVHHPTAEGRGPFGL